jgi:putative chitinase
MTQLWVRMAQARLGAMGLYLGNVDGDPGPLTCDALVRFLAGPHAPQVGPALSLAIPAAWWVMPNRVGMLLAQVNTESGFQCVAENLNYSADGLMKTWPHRFDPAHGGKADPHAYAGLPVAIANLVYSGRNGNMTPGDGYKYRGRGWPQLSGRANYRTYSDAAGTNLELLPDLALQFDITARVTVAFMQRTPGLQSAADDGDVSAVRYLWNGGDIGLESATDSFSKLCMLWGSK